MIDQEGCVNGEKVSDKARSVAVGETIVLQMKRRFCEGHSHLNIGRLGQVGEYFLRAY